MQLKERAQFHRKLLMIMANGADGVGGERNQSDLRRQTINQTKPTNEPSQATHIRAIITAILN